MSISCTLGILLGIPGSWSWVKSLILPSGTGISGLSTLGLGPSVLRDVEVRLLSLVFVFWGKMALCEDSEFLFSLPKSHLS